MYSKDFVQTLQHDREQWVEKTQWSEIFQKFFFMGQMSNFAPIVAQDYGSLYLRVYSKDFFQTLQNDKVQ